MQKQMLSELVQPYLFQFIPVIIYNLILNYSQLSPRFISAKGRLISIYRSTLTTSLGVCTSLQPCGTIPFSLQYCGDLSDTGPVDAMPWTFLAFCETQNLCICFSSSYRAKPAGNSSDASGMDDSDLEKMKQVKFSLVQEHHLLTRNYTSVGLGVTVNCLFCRRSLRRCEKNYKK